ncbi:sterile alpha motif domain-containing protein 14 isoform X3 [Dryobates pubescens]|uniref:sterile alpha motif domain-containing protein 14 isoform X3 n=1 Tax=Dryobates pubescens TaxID=118200 RepID=UPI0023BA0769|nr:sterile alpha motif domain-containing protein 14 isoform X3 [Dryobates pubescens]
MSVSKLQDVDEVFDFTAVVPETPRLDSSLQKARARLLAKGRRQRPSRSRLRDSASSTEGDEGPEPTEGLVGTPSPKSCHSSDSSPGFARRDARPQRHSEDDSRDMSPPEPGSPTVGLDKKTRRKFLDLGVTLRRASSSKSRKEKGSNRRSMGSREAVEGSGRPSGSPFLPFSSWFSDGARGSASPGSASPAGSPRHEGLSPNKSASQDSTLSEDSPPPSASPRLPGPPSTKCSYPYHTLSQSSDELSVPSSWTSPRGWPRAGRASRWGSGWRASTWSSMWRSSQPTASMAHGSCTLMEPSSRRWGWAAPRTELC